MQSSEKIKNYVECISIKKNELLNCINIPNLHKISLISQDIDFIIKKIFKTYRKLSNKKIFEKNISIVYILRLKEIIKIMKNFLNQIYLNDNNIKNIIENGRNKLDNYLEVIEFILNL